MTEEEKWGKVRQIVKEELDQLEQRLLSALGKKSTRLSFSGGKWTGITEEHLSAWSGAYPAVNVEEELKKAAAWIVSNPTDAPKSNFARFLNTWMDRNQSRAAIRAIPGREPPTAVKKSLCKYCMRSATGVVNGIAHCPAHIDDAMDGKQAVA